MRRIGRFLQLPRAERRLFLRTLPLVAAVRLALTLLPFQMLLRIVNRAASPGNGGRGAATDKIPWAVSSASRFVPKATCLTQALAGRILLGREGLQSALRLGVASGGKGPLRAHAWLESGGRVVIGGAGVDQFTAFSPIDVQ